MLDCTCLIHPFQNDPGTSQRQRTMEDLLTGAAKIDARTLADLLDYFVQLSGHINYYDFELNTKDWQPFFKKSIPFALAAMIKYPLQNVESNFELYKSIFEKKPTAAGLQLNSCFIFYRFIKTINDWHKVLVDSDLPIVQVIEELIKNKLQQPVKWFISYANAAVKAYGIKRIDFTELTANAIWGIDLADIYAIDTSFSAGTKSKFKKLHNLNEEFSALVPILSNAVKIISKEAEQNIEKSFIPLKEELQQQHQPQLALIFAFLNLFRQLQDDLNKYTRKHLDYFYKDILKFKSAEAIADKAHVIFEIQKQLESYLLKKGLKVKDGKDDKKQQILFALDDDIVVTKTTIADKRTLFVNNKSAYANTYVEGVYMAPAAEKLDGVEIDFKDDPKNFPTLGAKYSKYQDPETKLFKPYPNARLGFVLASQVLFLQTGSSRKITITIDCKLDDKVCNRLANVLSPQKKGCCPDNDTAGVSGNKENYPSYFLPGDFYEGVNSALSTTYYYLNQDILKKAIGKGISQDMATNLRTAFLVEDNTAYNSDYTDDYCNCPSKKDRYEGVLIENDYKNAFNKDEREILIEWIKPRRPLNILFSGEKDWIEPVIDTVSVDDLSIYFAPTPLVGNNFTLNIIATLPADKPAVTFYDKNNLKEDLGTTQPLVKIELDDKIKLIDIGLKGKPAQAGGKDKGCCEQTDKCCLLIDPLKDKHNISLYHFFRNVLIDEVVNPAKQIITVNVCGLKNFIVQNDNSVMDVNSVILPFGNQPEIGSNFYISSKEIFCKNWTDLNVRFNWKDLPSNFNDYYHGYEDSLASPPIDSAYFDVNNFKYTTHLLKEGTWLELHPPALFPPSPKELFTPDSDFICPVTPGSATGNYYFKNTFFTNYAYHSNKNNSCFKQESYRNDSRNGFLKITLQNRDFQYDRYPFVLTRQMMALGKFPEVYVGPVYDGTFIVPPMGSTTIPVFKFDDLFKAILDAENIAQNLKSRLTTIVDKIHNDCPTITPFNATISYVEGEFKTVLGDPLREGATYPETPPTPNPPLDQVSVKKLINFLEDSILSKTKDEIDNIKNIRVVIPNKPYLPQISGMFLDYKANATLEDIDLIHLYPYTGTYKHEEIKSQPTLFPTFCDEGSLFLGLKDQVPGDNLNILFQLAEATSDSEADKEEVYWYYLDSNVWKPLRNGFEVLDDTTKNLTTSGIVKLALPANMTKDNTVMPKDMHWIKAAIARNSKAVSETFAIIPQAMLAIFTNDEANDKARLAKPLPAGGISKLNEADANIKSVAQPFASFGGAVPEIENQFYVRVSETLRHKGRAIQAFDYERLALQAFPELYKVKCINHSFALNAHEYSNDFPYAPGYVMLAVIPDLNKLNAGNSFEPKVPVSIIEDIELFMRTRTSPFVRFRAMNPRYEKMNFCLRVRLVKGKDENYFREKIKQDIKELLAPWAIGKYDKLTFGQCIYRSDIIGLLEKSGYVDFIADFRMGKENDVPSAAAVKVCPATPRSILIAGDIEVCIEKPGCETWSKTYTQCENEKPVSPCSNKPELIMNYCK